MKIAIVGLGVVGLSVSARLAQAGYDVSGFERFPRGLSQGSSRGDTRIFRLAPGEGSVYVDLAANALRGWQALEKHVGKQIIDWTSGYMAGPSGSDFVQSCVLLAKTHRCEYTVVDAKEVERFTSEWITFPSGWDICHLTDCGVIRADEAISALVRSALDHGAQLHWGWQVEAPIQGSSLKIGVTWDRFDRVIVSSGPWLPSLLPEFANFVNVTRKVVAWFAPKDAGASPPNLPLICVDDANGAYGMPTPRGLYKIGLDAYDDNRVQPDDVPPPQADDIAVIARTAQRYLPKHGVVPVHDDA